ncbi:MAG: hypothetical protein ACYC7H_13025, partial [Chloroflexota bacterium]
MEFTFERGSTGEPRGHALLYFRSTRDRTEVLATYLVVPPVTLNLSRYMPPLLSGNVPASQMQQISSVPLPPVPEVVEGHASLVQLAGLRGDDLIYGGTLDPDDAQQGLMLAGEAAQRYFSLYAEYLRQAPLVGPGEGEEEGSSGGVSDVIYGLMSEKQRLGELAKLAGQLRYAVDGSDERQVRDTVREMEALGHHVPEKYRVAELIAAARLPGPRGQRLSQLYVDRCYRL